MSSTNRRDNAATFPAERGNGSSSPSTQREPSKASNSDLPKSNGARDSNSIPESSSAVWKSFALSDLQVFTSSNSIASSSAQGAAGPSVTNAHKDDRQEPDSVNNSLAGESRKRGKLAANDPRKRSKHSIAERDELAQGSGEVDDTENDTVPSNIAEKEYEDLKNVEAQVNAALPYRSIKTINIPKRSNQDKSTDAERRPQEDDSTTWYGTMSYRESLITYFCDEVGMSYEKTRSEDTVLQCFPDRKVSTEWVRQCHQNALNEQFVDFGLKDEADIPLPTAAESRRGQPRVMKEKALSSTAAKNNNQAGQNKAVQESARPGIKNGEPRFVREAPARQLEMTSIVVFKDLYDLSFDKIRKLLREDFDWVISSDQVEHFYYLARPSAYGSKGHRNRQDFPDLEEMSRNESFEAAAGIPVGMSRGNTGGG